MCTGEPADWLKSFVSQEKGKHRSVDSATPSAARDLLRLDALREPAPDHHHSSRLRPSNDPFCPSWALTTSCSSRAKVRPELRSWPGSSVADRELLSLSPSPRRRPAGKVRLAKWYQTLPPKNKNKIVKDVTQLVLARRTRMSNILEYKGASCCHCRLEGSEVGSDAAAR